MKTIKTDNDGNIQIKNGTFHIIDGKDSMVQECWHRAFMFQGDDMFNKDKGLMSINTLKGGLQTSGIIVGIVESMVEDNEEVYDSTASIEKSDDKYYLSLNVDSIYGSFDI